MVCKHAEPFSPTLLAQCRLLCVMVCRIFDRSGKFLIYYLQPWNNFVTGSGSLLSENLTGNVLLTFFYDRIL